MRAFERLLNYVKYDTQSIEEANTYPSSTSQLDFAKVLFDELLQLNVPTNLDEFGYVIGRIPSNITRKVPVVAFIAHMDTSPDASGKNISPRIIQNYDGKEIILNKISDKILSPETFPSLHKHIGHDLIVTDGTTLLGADNKAGISEIMTVVEIIMSNPMIEHGEIVIVFTPDEEVGNGTLHLDVTKINADFGYTIDGSDVGEIAYENFNAASAKVVLNGKSVHPGSAKNKMVNSISLSYEFDHLLPIFSRPENTEKYEGFNHLHGIQGNCEQTILQYIIRNHDKILFNKQKQEFILARDFMNQKYGSDTCLLEISDSYFNMKEKLLDQFDIVTIALNAIEECGVTPLIEPIRGGTDGATLTYMGLPCPNLGTGGYNFHGPYEYASIQEMDQSVDIILNIIKQISNHTK